MKRLAPIVLIIVISFGCSAHRAPKMIDSSKSNIVPLISTHKPAIALLHTEKLENKELMISTLKRSNLFSEISDGVSVEKKPDFVVEVVTDRKTSSIYPSCGMGMISTIFTLGIFPHWSKATYTSSFNIYRYGSSDIYTLKHDEESENIVGIIAIFYRMSKDWFSEYPMDKHYEPLAYNIYKETQNIK